MRAATIAQKLDALRLLCGSSGRHPLPENLARVFLGPKFVREAKRAGLIEDAWWHGLSRRAANILCNCDLRTRAAVRHAIIERDLHPGRVRLLGWKTYNEIRVWAGLGAQTPRTVMGCPHCRRPIWVVNQFRTLEEA